VSTANPGELKVSVIIPSKDHYEYLRECLQSIGASNWVPDAELIMIDSSLNEQVRTRNASLVKKLGGKCFHEAKKGQAAARNTGIRRASGEIVVFLDDDCVVDKNWLKSLIRNYDAPEVVCCSGRVLSRRRDELSELFEKYMSFDRGDKKRTFTRQHINLLRLLKAVTYLGRRSLSENLPAPWCVAGDGFYSFRKEIFQKVGYFDEDLRKGALSAGEDTDMLYRVLKAGYKITYEPEALVFHDHPHSLEDILKKVYTYGGIKLRFYLKYLSDYYMLLSMFGSLLLSLSTLAKALIKRESNLARIMAEDLKGILSELIQVIKEFTRMKERTR